MKDVNLNWLFVTSSFRAYEILAFLVPLMSVSLRKPHVQEVSIGPCKGQTSGTWRMSWSTLERGEHGAYCPSGISSLMEEGAIQTLLRFLIYLKEENSTSAHHKFLSPKLPIKLWDLVSLASFSNFSTLLWLELALRRSILSTYRKRLSVLNQFPKCNVHTDCLGILLNWKFLLRRSVRGPECLHFL